MMIKKNMKTLILTSIITLIPMIVGIVLWNRLPDSIPSHFNFKGEPDAYSSKMFVVFAIPLFLIVLEWVCALFTVHSPKSKNISNKIFALVLWIIPIVSLLVTFLIYGYTLGVKMDISLIANVFMGIILIIIGNYLPKTRQNYVIGIKLPWTLDDEENWNKTHRFAGRLWTLTGAIIIVLSIIRILPMYISLLLVILVAIIPSVYSYIIYRNKK